MSAALLSDVVRTARKAHQCGWCGTAIEPSDRYREQRLAEDGTVWTWREHMHCGAFIAKHLEWWEYEYIDHPRRTYDDLVADFGPPNRVLLSVSPASGPGGDRPTAGHVTPNHDTGGAA